MFICLKKGETTLRLLSGKFWKPCHQNIAIFTTRIFGSATFDGRWCTAHVPVRKMISWLLGNKQKDN